MANFRFKGLAPSSLQPAPIPQISRKVLDGIEREDWERDRYFAEKKAALAVAEAIHNSSPTTLTQSRETDALVTSQTRLNEAVHAVTEAVMEQPAEVPTHSASEAHSIQDERDADRKAAGRKLDRLIAHDFSWDPSQEAAIEGMASQQYACLTGAAGTGKTTVTKGLVDKLLDQGALGEVDMTQYFRKDMSSADEDDDYEVLENFVPSICLCAFTGQASQMIKKNFPLAWHTNIMTIHRMLGFYPEFYEEWDENYFDKETGTLGGMRNKMRFVPAYNADNRMPWDDILIDEAGMQALDLWNQVWAALKPGARVFMVGDINQLPPVHGRSIFGFAMTKWPSYELTEIHRQVGVNNSIVENAWRILQGKSPISEAPREAQLHLLDKEGIIRSLNWMVANRDWKTLLLKIPDNPATASRHIRMMLTKLQDRFYDPIRDAVITAINGKDGSNGRVLGQIPLNMELAIALNHDGQRFIIDAGRERKNFGVGEKVMNTRNDHEAGITNGMTGIIKSIERNAAYAGDTLRFDTVENVAAYMADLQIDDDDEDFTLESISESMAAQSEGREAAKEGRDRGPASHIVTVTFGHGEHEQDMYFATLSEVASLMTAYAVTCHKMQGSECPHVFLICHSTHKQMLFREWGYTGWTRAAQKIILLYTDVGLRQMLNKQRIKGTTLVMKVAAFNELQKDYGAGVAVKVKLPEPVNLSTGIATITSNIFMPIPAAMTEIAEIIENTKREIDNITGIAAILETQSCSWCGTTHEGGPENCPPLKPDYRKPEVRERIIERVIIAQGRPAFLKDAPIDGGTLNGEAYQREREQGIAAGLTRIDRLMAAAKGTQLAPSRAPILLSDLKPHTIPQYGAVLAMQRIEDLKEQRLLGYQPTQEISKPRLGFMRNMGSVVR